MKSDPSKPLTFRTVGIGKPNDVLLSPFYKFDTHRYSVYWKVYNVFQLQSHTRSRFITVQERIDGSLHLINGKKTLRYTEIPKTSLSQLHKQAEPQCRPGNHSRVPKGLDHPWRNFKFGTLDPKKTKGDISTLEKG